MTQGWGEIIAGVGGLAASGFALLRLTLSQQKAITERFIAFLEESLRRQDSTIEGFRDAVGSLTASVSENTVVIRQIREHLSAPEVR